MFRRLRGAADTILLGRFDATGIAGAARLLAAIVVLTFLFNDYFVFQLAAGRMAAPFDVNPYFAAKIAHPFTPLDTAGDGTTHYEKLAFRLVPFIVAHVFQLEHRGLFGLQLVLGAVFPFLIWKAIRDSTESPALATSAALTVNALYVGFSFFFDAWFFDGFAYFLIVLAMLAPRPWQRASLCICAGFTDERALLASAGVFVWHWYRSGDLALGGARAQIPWYVSFCVVYVAMRLAIGGLTGLQTGRSGISLTTAWANLTNIELLAWAVFEGAWLLVIAASARLGRIGAHAMLGASLLSLAAIVAAGLLIGDTVRSHQYAFPLLLVAYAVLGRQGAAPSDSLQRWAVGLTLITPMVVYLGFRVENTVRIFNIHFPVPGYAHIMARIVEAIR